MIAFGTSVPCWLGQNFAMGGLSCRLNSATPSLHAVLELNLFFDALPITPISRPLKFALHSLMWIFLSCDFLVVDKCLPSFVPQDRPWSSE